MIVLVCGIPASGKSTICEGKETFSFDAWLKSFYGTEDVEQAGWIFIHDGKGMDAYLNDVMKLYEACECDLWLDDGAVNRERRKAIVKGLRERGVKHIKCLYLLCDLYVASARNEERNWSISRNNFYGSWAIQEYPLESEGFDSIEFKVTV